ncbi:MAG: hypothetical protein RRZ83_03890 [Alistipes sp.]
MRKTNTQGCAYVAPAIEITSISIEKGFAVSFGTPGGDVIEDNTSWFESTM